MMATLKPKTEQIREAREKQAEIERVKLADAKHEAENMVRVHNEKTPAESSQKSTRAASF